MFLLGYLLLTLLQGTVIPIPGLPESSNVKIIDGGKSKPVVSTTFDPKTTGPSAGDMLNHHYFPAINDYNAGRFTSASMGLSYAINSAGYLVDNPRQAQFISMAYYLRGMIFLYHAEGIGRHMLAKADFENATKWDPKNYVAYLELSRVYSSLGFADQANLIIRRLLSLNPDEDIRNEAQSELNKLAEK